MKTAWSHIHPKLKKVLKKQRSFQEKLFFHIPNEYHDKVHCHLETGFLKIYAGNSAWASKLRYQQHQILKSIQADPELNVQKIQIMVGRGMPKVHQREKLPVNFDSNSAKSLLQSAEACSDPELKAAFISLANRAGQKR